MHTCALLLTICIGKMPLLSERFDKLDVSCNIDSNIAHGITTYYLITTSLLMGTQCLSVAPCSRVCSLEEQYFKCGIFWDYHAPQRRVSSSEAPVLAGGIPFFLRGSQFSGASELKERPVSKYKVINTTRLQLSYFCN